MDEKTLTERQAGNTSIRQDLEQLVNEGVQAVGRETMESQRNRMREGIVQQDIEWLNLDGTK